MKWLFALLLLVNLGLFLWGYRHDPVADRPDLTSSAGIGNLKLLSELRDETKPELVNPETITTSPAVVESTAAAPTETETPMVGLPLPPIEPETTEAPPSPEEPTPPEPAVSSGKPVNRCGTLGVIEDRQQARKMVQELEQQSGVKATLQEESAQTRLGFWVVIPPLPSNEAAQQKLKELAAAGVTDVWHFTNGDMKNAISLGMFSQESNAQNFQQEMKQRGFDTELRPRYLNKRQYTVQVQIKAKEKEADAAWHRIRQQYSDVHSSELPCSRIATQ